MGFTVRKCPREKRTPNAFTRNLLLTRTNLIYTQKVSTGEENSLMHLPEICCYLGPMGFTPRKCPREKRTPQCLYPKCAFNQDQWDLHPESGHGRRELPNSFTRNLLLRRTNRIYTQKVSTGEDNSLIPVPEICC